MRILMICILLFSAYRVGMGNEAEEPLRRIELSIQQEPSVFGIDVPLIVRYRNNSEEPWVVPDPPKSADVWLRRRPSGTDRHTGGYDMAPAHVATIEGPNGVRAWSFPKGDPVAIQPKRFHQFTTPLERDWTGDVRPGRWTVWLIDHNVGIESNRLEVSLIFTGDSLAACLEIVRDKTNHRSKRKWHGEEILKRFMPDLNLRWWDVWPNEPQPEEQERMEAAIQRELDRFEAFWKDPANAPAIEAAIERINREGGLLPKAQEEGGDDKAPGGWGIRPDGHNAEGA